MAMQVTSEGNPAADVCEYNSGNDTVQMSIQLAVMQAMQVTSEDNPAVPVDVDR